MINYVRGVRGVMGFRHIKCFGQTCNILNIRKRADSPDRADINVYDNGG